MKLKIVMLIVLALLIVKTMVVKTQSTYFEESSYTVSIVPDRSSG